eukprot:2112668-Amphidinium_carterae.1
MDGLKSRMTTTRSMDYFIQDDELGEDYPQQEAQAPRTYKSPVLPTQQEIDERNVTHLPYRDWCKHCVQGKS